ncbi:hypothetical protein JXB12_03565 [candidate division KSB1 bacterium]|nr:hypothetical protein [candidate division KSB1 bacterium]
MDDILDLFIMHNFIVKTKRYLLLSILLVLTTSIPDVPATELNFFNGQDTLNFIPRDCDSVFIFSEHLAVTVFGPDLEKLDYINNAIDGENIPPTLRIRKPIGAILYRGSEAESQLPCIKGRMNAMVGRAELIRNYVTGLNLFKGTSSKGEISIRVWEKGGNRAPLLVYLKDGTILYRDMQTPDVTSADFYCRMDVETLSQWFGNIEGVWIHPPSLGTLHIRQEIRRTMTRGPIILEIWDGLSWDLLEKAYLSGGLPDNLETAQMAFALMKSDSLYDDIVRGLNVDDSSIVAKDDGTRKVGNFYKVDGTLFPELVKWRNSSTDYNACITADSMVFARAFEVIRHHEPRFLLIHYSGVQRIMQMHGNSNDMLLLHLDRLRAWHGQILNNWVGSVFIMSTHGIDVRNDSDHLERLESPANRDFIFEKMAVPILIYRRSPTSP